MNAYPNDISDERIRLYLLEAYGRTHVLKQAQEDGVFVGYSTTLSVLIRAVSELAYPLNLQGYLFTDPKTMRIVASERLRSLLAGLFVCREEQGTLFFYAQPRFSVEEQEELVARHMFAHKLSRFAAHLHDETT